MKVRLLKGHQLLTPVLSQVELAEEMFGRQIGLDCNVLVQLAIADHPANARTLAAVETEALQGKKLVFPSLVATEFLHVVTNERRFAPPLTMPKRLTGFRIFSPVRA